MINKACVSVIVPIYNTKEQLRRCIDSILSQSFKEHEVILVDDGSTDGSSSICDDYLFIEDRIKVIHQENRGVSSARNSGLEISTGEYVCFVDSDDWIEPTFLERGMSVIAKEKCDIFLSGLIYDSNRSSISVGISNKIVKPSSDLNEQDYVELLRNNYIASSCGNIYSKRFLNGKFDSSVHFGEDLRFVFEYLNMNPRIYASTDCFYHYVYNKNSAVHTINEKKVKGVLSTYLFLFDYCYSRFPSGDVFLTYITKRWELDYVICLNQIKEAAFSKRVKLLKQLNNNLYLRSVLKKSNDKYICRYGLHPYLFVIYSLYKKSKRTENDS